MKKSSAKKTSKKATQKSAPKRAKISVRAAAASKKSKAAHRKAAVSASKSTTSNRKSFTKSTPPHRETPHSLSRNTQFADEQDIPKDDMDVVVDESLEGSEEENHAAEGDHSPRQYHRAEDLKQHQKDARKPKGHAQDAPVVRRDSTNTHKRG